VPAGLGGVLTGRQAIVDQFRQTAGAGSFEIKQIFGDDKQVCVVGKVTAERFVGSRYLRGAERPYSTYECIVYRITDGKVAESTAYINWLDPYVQLEHPHQLTRHRPTVSPRGGGGVRPRDRADHAS
jgi:hypothetical protein